MNVYTPAGWPDAAKMLSQGCKFVFVVGGRGTGKTYSFLKDVLIDRPRDFLYLRRTEKELKLCMTPKLNPFRRINHDFHRDFKVVKDGELYMIADGENIIGSCLALSSCSSVRGMDAYDTQTIIFDEFIKDKNQRKTIKNEADAFFNLYETVNRNREIEVLPDGTTVTHPELATQAVLLANANDSANPLFMALNLVMLYERMKQRGVFPAVYKNPDRGLLLVDFGETNRISQAKKGTALYRLTAGTDYASMALENKFAYDDPSRQASRDLRQYKPVVFVGELAIYKSKSNDMYYCTQHRRGGADTYGSGETELQRFRYKFAWLWVSYMADKIEFESYAAEALLKKYYDAS